MLLSVNITAGRTAAPHHIQHAKSLTAAAELLARACEMNNGKGYERANAIKHLEIMPDEMHTYLHVCTHICMHKTPTHTHLQ